MLHYIAILGDKGCLPDSCKFFFSMDEAIKSLIEALRLDPNGQYVNKLRTYGYVSLPEFPFGFDYAEVTKCTCDNPGKHGDN